MSSAQCDEANSFLQSQEVCGGTAKHCEARKMSYDDEVSPDPGDALGQYGSICVNMGRIGELSPEP